MHDDPMSFERRLEAAFDAYVTPAPVHVDSAALVAELSGARAPMRWSVLSRRPVVRLALVLAAVVLAAAVAVVGARLLDRPPLGGGGRILVTYPVGPSTLVTLDGSTITTRDVELQGCPMVAGNADVAITEIRFVGVRYRSFDGEGSSIVPKADYGVEWSSDHRTLARVNLRRGEIQFVRIVSGDADHPVTTTVTIDQSPVDQDGNHQFWGTFNHDGTQFLVRAWAGGTGVSRLSVVDVATGTIRPIAEIGVTADDVFTPSVWSIGNDAVAAIGTHDGVTQVAVVTLATGGIRWLGRPPGMAADTPVFMNDWDAYASRIPVWTEGRLHLLDPATGAWASLPATGASGLLQYAVAPDGRTVAMIGGTTLTRIDVATGAMEAVPLGSPRWAWSPDRTAIAVLVPAADELTAQVRVLDPWSDAPTEVVATVPGESVANMPVTDPSPCIQWLSEVQP